MAKIFLVASSAESWMNTGYGHSLLHGDAIDLLVSFAEFSAKPGQQLAVTTMASTYEPKSANPANAILASLSLINDKE